MDLPLLIVTASMVLMLFAAAIGVFLWLLRESLEFLAAPEDPSKSRQPVRAADQWDRNHPLFSMRAGQ